MEQQFNDGIVMTGDRSALTLQILGPIEGLLLLEEEGVAHERQSANSLTVSSVRRLSAPLVDGRYIVRVKPVTHGSGHGMPSLLVKYSASSPFFPPRTPELTPEMSAAMSAGPLLMPILNLSSLPRAPPVAPAMA